MDTPHDTPARTLRSHPVWRTLAVVATAALLAFLWLPGLIGITFGSFQPAIHGLCWTALCLGLFALVLGWAAGWRWLRRLGIAAALLAIAVSGAAALHRWVAVDRFATVPKPVGSVQWWRFNPFDEGNELPACDAPAEYRFQDGGPRLRAAYALYPIAAAAAQALGTPGTYGGTNRWRHLSYGGSDDLFAHLYTPLLGYDQPCDAVFALAPSDDQIAAAAEKGIAFDLTPIARDAFVFFVHADNPCTNLAIRQIQDIYSGRARTWRDVGVDFDARLLPFQRNKNSGSQTTLERLMGDIPIMPPLEEDRLGGMGDIFRDVADYRNRRGAIGFSFRYYATELVNAGKIRLLSFDGIPPTPENIASGRYPFIATSYLVTTAAPRSPDVRRLADFLASPTGRALVAAVGYVPPAPPRRADGSAEVPNDSHEVREVLQAP